MRIAFCAAEVKPFVKVGGLGDVVGELPLALELLGLEIFVIVPKYKSIDQRKYGLKKVKEDIYEAIIGNNVKAFFIDHEEYFHRNGIYGDDEGDFKDNLSRYQFFCQRALELLKDLDLKVDIVHCHDWHTALIPVFIKERYGKDQFFFTFKVSIDHT